MIVLLSARFEDTITAGVGGNLTSEAELLAAIQIAIDSGTLGDNLFTDPSYQARALENLSGIFCFLKKNKHQTCIGYDILCKVILYSTFLSG